MDGAPVLAATQVLLHCTGGDASVEASGLDGPGPRRQEPFEAAAFLARAGVPHSGEGVRDPERDPEPPVAAPPSDSGPPTRQPPAPSSAQRPTSARPGAAARTHPGSGGSGCVSAWRPGVRGSATPPPRAASSRTCDRGLRTLGSLARGSAARRGRAVRAGTGMGTQEARPGARARRGGTEGGAGPGRPPAQRGASPQPRSLPVPSRQPGRAQDLGAERGRRCRAWVGGTTSRLSGARLGQGLQARSPCVYGFE